MSHDTSHDTRRPNQNAKHAGPAEPNRNHDTRIANTNTTHTSRTVGTLASPGSAVRFDAIQHRFGSTTVIHRLDLSIQPGELVALLGPSGCGKSTLLRILAGLQAQTSGHVVIGDASVDGLSPSERGVGIVFQNYALFPHMSVLANVAYGLEAKGVKRTAASVQAKAMLEMVRMSAFGERFPRELSGGQQQRVALARTLAVKPRILLLDEPFAALDKSLRLDMQIEIRRLQRELNITTIMVTHDQEEAMSMADRVAVLNNGRLEQFAPAAEIYDRPASPFVASFVGTANMLPARLMFGAGGSDSPGRIALIGPAQARLMLDMPDGDDVPAPAPQRQRQKSEANAAIAGAVEATITTTTTTTTTTTSTATTPIEDKAEKADRRIAPHVVLAVRPEQWDWAPTPAAVNAISDPAADGLPVIVQLVLPLGPSLMVDTLLADTIGESIRDTASDTCALSSDTSGPPIAIKLILSRGQSVLPQTGQRITLRIKPHTAIRLFRV